MLTLRVTRDSAYTDFLRAYSVVLDGKTIGEVRSGETKDFYIPAGPHHISLKIVWCSSKAVRFTSVEGHPLALRARSNVRGIRLLWILWYVLVARDSYLWIEPASGS